MEIQSMSTGNDQSVFITVASQGTVVSVYSRGTQTSFNFSNTVARTLAERIINALDNFQLTTTKEQDHAELRN